MPDPLFEWKQQVDRQMLRRLDETLAQRNIPLLPQLVQQTNALAAGRTIQAPSQTAYAYATGFDGTNTTMAFTLDVSSLGGPDLLTG